MIRTNDPRIRRRIDQLSQNLQSANETAQEGVYHFSQAYLNPCLTTIGNFVRACTAPCFPSREEVLRRRRRRSRAEFSFDFYDDWDNDDSGDSLLGWSHGELDRLLAGSGAVRNTADQPRRQRKMSYGAARMRRRSTLPDQRDDPTVIPKSSLIGFLERFPWIGPRVIKYRPSAADLQERPGRLSRYQEEQGDGTENQPLMEAAEEIDESPEPNKGKTHQRVRSTTQSSQDTTNSLSSRGDLILSDYDDEDAVPLDDEFADALARRATSDDQLTRSGESRRTPSQSTNTSQRESKLKSPDTSDKESLLRENEASIAEMIKEEEAVRIEEEREIERKRQAARQLAASRGLDGQVHCLNPYWIIRLTNGLQPPRPPSATSNYNMHQDQKPDEVAQEGTEPFPSLPRTPTSVRSASLSSMMDSGAETTDPNKPNG